MIFKQQPISLTKYLWKKVKIKTKDGGKIIGKLVDWNDGYIKIEYPLDYDENRNPIRWKIMKIERYKIDKLIVI